MTDDTKILYKDYTEEEPYEGDCCPPNYWTCEKGVGITLPEYASAAVSLMRAHGGKY